MKAIKENKTSAGFSIIELLIAMTIMLVILGLAANLFSKALNTRRRESSRTDALTAAQAALNVISRELANSGYGLVNNGIVAADSNRKTLHFLANVTNTNNSVTDPRENITYYFDELSKSILRYDANDTNRVTNPDGTTSPKPSIIINRISDVDFEYYNYTGSSSTGTMSLVPTPDTGRVRVTIIVNLEDVQGQIKNQKVKLISDVTLRNSNYMLQQY